MNDETIIQYVSPGAEYFMGETDEILDLSYPPINIVNKCTWKREKLDSNSLLTRYGFKVLSYQCDQPIKTEEKTGERAIH